MENESMDCPIVVDLLPLYLEGKISRESAAFVQNHLEMCDSCRKECQWMQASFVDESEKGEKRGDLSEEWEEQIERPDKVRETAGRKSLKRFSIAKHKLLLYGYLILLTIVVVYCIADFIAW